jgi:hypothetical protein
VNWSPRDYDRLERAIVERRRLRLLRGGSELTVLPERLATEFGMEVLSARHLGTGERVQVGLEEIEGFDVLG